MGSDVREVEDRDTRIVDRRWSLLKIEFGAPCWRVCTGHVDNCSEIEEENESKHVLTTPRKRLVSHPSTLFSILGDSNSGWPVLKSVPRSLAATIAAVILSRIAEYTITGENQWPRWQVCIQAGLFGRLPILVRRYIRIATDLDCYVEN